MGKTLQTQDDVECGLGEWTMDIINKIQICVSINISWFHQSYYIIDNTLTSQSSSDIHIIMLLIFVGG